MGLLVFDLSFGHVQEVIAVLLIDKDCRSSQMPSSAGHEMFTAILEASSLQRNLQHVLMICKRKLRFLRQTRTDGERILAKPSNAMI
jgi:hypothetical protein